MHALAISLMLVVAAPGGGKHGGPCKEDAEKLCPGMHPGDGKFHECMKQHLDQLSDACKEKMAEHKEHAEEFHKDCADDVKKLCGDVKPGGGRIIECLKQKQAQASPACRTVLNSKGEHGGGLPTPPAPPPAPTK
ncbi:MAG: cysteine rich repeat-containing protein [Deltaproteobacteria bacterium]|nr:cysteine rich repeat-containing protein [Deltaproteobacteria bacterium]